MHVPLELAPEDTVCMRDTDPRVFQVFVDGQKRIVLCGENKCAICNSVVSVTSEAYAIDYHIDGRLACDACRAALTSGFQSLYHVCLNVLCRRKWKQLTPRIVPFFCPSCRKQLEMRLKPRVDGNPQANELNELDYLYALHHYWSRVMEQLSTLLVFPWKSSVLPPPCTVSSDATPLRDTLAAIRESFEELTIDVEKCRNWNSMLVRKKYYRGYVLSKDLVSCVCQCVAECELTENFEEIPPPKRNGKLSTKAHRCKCKYFVLDWKDELRCRQQIYFISFPNPVGDKKRRDFVGTIIKIICGPENMEVGRTGCDVPDTIVQVAYCTREGRKIPCPVMMEPSKITSPFATYLDPTDTVKVASPLTMMATPSPGVSWLKTPSLASPSATPWKVMHRVQPLWNHAGSGSTDGSNLDAGSQEVRRQQSPLPPGLELQDEPPMGVGGFGDLMQWSDAVKENNDADREGSEWYAPLDAQLAKAHEKEYGERSTKKRPSDTGIRSVPEHSEVLDNCAIPLHLTDSARTSSGSGNANNSRHRTVVPQSPFAVYFGD